MRAQRSLCISYSKRNYHCLDYIVVHHPCNPVLQMVHAHLSDMKAMPKRELEVIAYHEGLPGHHMQISIAQELESVGTSTWCACAPVKTHVTRVRVKNST
jgi:hypothetical protein